MELLQSSNLETVIAVVSLAVSFVATIATICIPILLARLASSENRRLTELQDYQAETLEKQKAIHQRQRRDALLDQLRDLSDRVRLSLVWEEIAEFDPCDQILLKTAIRANPRVNLPGSGQGPITRDLLDDTAVSAYIEGMERRYGIATQFKTFDGFSGFVWQLKDQSPAQLEKHKSALVAVLVGPCAEVQRPSHQFFRRLIADTPEFAVPLLYAVEDMSYELGGFRLNALTGTLLAVVDIIEERQGAPRLLGNMREDIAHGLAWLLHRGVLRSFEHWNLRGSSEPVSATVAWLIRVVGWAMDGDSHIGMRMVEKLHYSIESVPAEDRGWGVDAEDVAEGFSAIRRKAPVLWERHGDELMQAADEMGPWRENGEFAQTA
ncbi:hypothetical protein [Mycobacterium sp.]|uniref:hypothetical protein n=1 Tax=Mycobacterium sp. TaxID=1785 RepID=UPI002C065BA8|nr:hypothetical protein [Mycobacterium sp.]HKP39628.1 hypothetical protein [Mycobacterium sp.]